MSATSDHDGAGHGSPGRAEPDEPKPIGESVEEAASGKLGVQQWDRPGIFRETAAAATDVDLPYWLALTLSGAIATLGLAIDSSAVVIGAMLVAPLLAPVLGLAMALAVGDGRLAVQSGAVVVASTFAVLATAAILTLVLPFQSITLEISQRTSPTTLDLAIAVFSGLVGAVVIVSRGKRLSAVIPGVAIAVALIPPLGVAGFGMGADWNARLIHGALLLYGANLGGIVLSGMLVFLLVGMHRPNVLEEARRWHAKGESTGLAEWVTRNRWVRSLGTMESPWKRISLVLAFVVAVAVPLSETMGQLARERRVRDAVEAAADMFNVPGQSSIVSRHVVLGDGRAQIYLRVATAEWFQPDSEDEFERRASAAAREPVTVVLEQLLTARGELDQAGNRLDIARQEIAAQARPPSPEESLRALRASARTAAQSLPFPPGTAAAGVDLTVNERGASVRLGYLSDTPLPEEAASMLETLLQRALALGPIPAQAEHVPSAPQPLGEPEEAREAVDRAGDLLRRYPLLQAELLAGEAVAEEALEAIRARLADLAGDSARIRIVPGHPEAGIHLRLHVADGPG
jgi:uncharacterized hydrophobic protein (TIGR00271 family)